MPRLSDNVRSALADWWDLAQDAGFGGYRATELIEAASNLANQAGRSLSFTESSALSTLFGYARRMSNAADTTQAAEDNTYIGPDHVAIPPWARVESEMNANPIWHVNYQFTYERNGIISTEYKTSIFEYGRFPQTIGELKDAIAADAAVLANKYQVNLINTDLTQILAV
jgi:hypothetical protein